VYLRISGKPEGLPSHHFMAGFINSNLCKTLYLVIIIYFLHF